MTPDDYQRILAACRADLGRLPAPALRWLLDYLMDTAGLHPADVAAGIRRWRAHELHQRQEAAWAAYQAAREAEIAALHAAELAPLPDRGVAVAAWDRARSNKDRAGRAWDRARRAADAAREAAP